MLQLCGRHSALTHRLRHGSAFATVPLCQTRMSSSIPSNQAVDSAAPHSVSQALTSVQSRITQVANDNGRTKVPRLVAVSKTKPPSAIEEAYKAGHRHFGENYVQELVDKAKTLPADIRWHFIGALQTNKAKYLAGIPNLFCVETVDREKTANALQKATATVERADDLNVMVQVNTSGEESKSGCTPEEAPELAAHVVEQCPNLKLIGLMTIGAPDTSDEPEAFRTLARAREAVSARLDVSVESLELSMGMSGDFEAAIRMGSDSVRVGSTIFGAREYPAKK